MGGRGRDAGELVLRFHGVSIAPVGFACRGTAESSGDVDPDDVRGGKPGGLLLGLIAGILRACRTGQVTPTGSAADNAEVFAVPDHYAVGGQDTTRCLAEVSRAGGAEQKRNG